MVAPDFKVEPRSLGFKEGQASPGPHLHSGVDGSKLLLDGVILTGDRSSGTALVNLIQILVDHFGLQDDTVA